LDDSSYFTGISLFVDRVSTNLRKYIGQKIMVIILLLQGPVYLAKHAVGGDLIDSIAQSNFFYECNQGGNRTIKHIGVEYNSYGPFL
jgi:hypothetical protein